MQKYLGSALYWVFSFIAFFVFSFAAYAVVEELRRGEGLRIGYLSFLILSAIAAWLIGRACQYLLDGH